MYSYSNPFPSAGSLLLLIGPTVTFDREESNKVLGFLDSGGMVFLADDFGSGNTLLENLNVSVRFSGQPISDLYFYSKQPIFPLVSNFAPDAITKNLTLLVMNRPSYLEVTNSTLVTVLARSSPFSFDDYSGNGELSPNETTQSYPVLASTHLGKGRLILVSNAGIFTNDMIGFFNNTIFFNNILNVAAGNIVFDVSHIKRALLTDQRVAFRADVDSLLMALQSGVVRAAVTVGVILTFTAIFLSRARLNRSRSLARNQAYIVNCLAMRRGHSLD